MFVLSKIIATPVELLVVQKLQAAELHIEFFTKEKHEKILTTALQNENTEQLLSSFGSATLSTAMIARLMQKLPHGQLLFDTEQNLIGFGSLQHNPLAVLDHLELGRHIFSPYINRGYGQLLGLSLIAHAHNELEKNVTARVNPNNLASYRSHLHLIKYFPNNRGTCELKQNNYYYFIYRRH